ncbi:MAG: hypothetical protein IT385_24760 [Deltaproteobacteria bacterium]|nr:hypothetical protein [Deltaproteobacteria bacterium]
MCPDLHARLTLGAALTGAIALALGACGDDPKRRLGETCSADFQCESGLCHESRCMDPEADDDADTLVNRIEDALGTSALLKDSDGDGALDAVEVGDVASPRDFDGDGFIDAIESAREDSDGDCVPNERDALDQSAEADLGKVADLACCCEGRCSTVGVTATATCAGGELTCTPEQPDRDGDGLADACDTPRLTLAPGEAESGCSAACGRMVEACDGAPPACVADCVARASDEGMWLANYVCLASTCNEARCFQPPGFAEDAECRDGCAQALACGLGDAFGEGTLTEGSCRASCAGEQQAENSAATAVYACLAGLPTTGCRLVDALPCFIGTQICSQACGKLAFPPTASTCRQGAPIYGAYTTEALCTSACADLSGFGEVAFLGCSAVKGCTDFSEVCEADPAAAATGCDVACEALAATCTFTDSPFSDASLCGAFCTGLGLAAPWIAPADAGACIGAAESCDTGDEAAALMVRCLLTSAIEPRCAAACERVRTCAAELGAPAPPDCEAGCMGLLLSHPERVEPMLPCIDEAATCTQVQGCLPPGPEDVCAPACNHILECNPNYLGGLVQCQADCRADLGADLDRYAAWMCEAQAPRCDVACGDLPNLPPDASCIEACEGKDTCVEAAYGLCARACQGARRAYGEATSNPCVLDNLGRRCNPIAVKVCDPS